MNKEEIHSKTDTELDFDMAQMKKELFETRMKASTQSVANPAQIRVLRRSIARINTVLHERATGIRGAETR